MRHLIVWALEFTKLLGGLRRHPIRVECPFCRQMVRLHVNNAGRRHVLAHAQSLYETSRLGVHYSANLKCVGSGATKTFHPRPNEHQRFKLPDSLLDP
jgi:hypothetical protein